MDQLYDPATLIELIEQRPIIWDKTVYRYKDKAERSKAWMEVYQLLIKNFEYLSEKEKVKVGKAVNNKWKHIRDAFTFSIKKKSSDKRTKEYKYFDELQFLMKVLQKDVNTDSDEHETERDEQNDEETTESVKVESVEIFIPTPSNCSSSRKRRKVSEATNQSPLKVDEDRAFYESSVSRALKTFTGDEKLEFRIGVLSLIQQIKAKRPIRPSSNNSCSLCFQICKKLHT